MDTSIDDSLSDAESNSSWILVHDGMCDDKSDKKTKLNVNTQQEHTEGLNATDLGSAGSGHESDTSDGISIISEFDSDQERNVQSEEAANLEENGSAEGCEESNVEEEVGSDEELDSNNIIQTMQSQIDEEKGTKHLKLPHFITISIFGAVFAVSSVFILQLINSPNVKDAATSTEFVQNRNNIALPKDTSNKIDKQDFDIVEYCAVKHENDDLFKDYNERKCMEAYKKQMKKKKSRFNQYNKMQKQQAKIEENTYISQQSTQIKKNNSEDTDVENYMLKKTKDGKQDYNKENRKKHKKRLKNNENNSENEKQSEHNMKLRNSKKKFLTAKYILAKEEFLIAKETYLKNKERYLRNMAVTVNEKWQNRKEKERKLENRNNTKTEKHHKQKFGKVQGPNKMEKRNKWIGTNKKQNLDNNFTKANKHDRTVAEKENASKYKHLALKMYRNRRNNSISGEWYHNLFDDRTQIRKKERQSEWMFDRAEMRNKRRDKAQWYFQWMTDREQFRYKRGYRFATN